MDIIQKPKMDLKSEAVTTITKWKTQMQNQQTDMNSQLKIIIFKLGKCQLCNLKQFLRSNHKIIDIK